jgi:hypothetical protein
MPQFCKLIWYCTYLLFAFPKNLFDFHLHPPPPPPLIVAQSPESSPGPRAKDRAGRRRSCVRWQFAAHTTPHLYWSGVVWVVTFLRPNPHHHSQSNSRGQLVIQ